MSSGTAPVRLQGWKKRELREHRSEAGVPNLRSREVGDGEDRVPGRRFVPRGPSVVKLGQGEDVADAVVVPWHQRDGRVKHFIPSGLNSIVDGTVRDEPFRGVVFCFAGWAAEEIGRMGTTMRRAATLRPGDFFLPREVPARFRFMDGAEGEKWEAFFVAAGWGADVARVLAGGERSSNLQAPSTKEAPVNSKGGRQ